MIKTILIDKASFVRRDDDYTRPINSQTEGERVLWSFAAGGILNFKQAIDLGTRILFIFEE